MTGMSVRHESTVIDTLGLTTLGGTSQCTQALLPSTDHLSIFLGIHAATDV